MKNRKGFTLIELVIVVAIIGILALMIIPQFNNVTNDAKVKTFTANCKVVTSAYAMYQAGNNGNLPSTDGDLESYINGGWAALKDSAGAFQPKGAGYVIENSVFKASFTDDKGTVHSYQYPTD